MNIPTLKKPCLAAALLTLASTALMLPTRAHADLVNNGGFETGDLSGWSGSILANPYSGVYCPGSGAAPQGSCEAFLGTAGSTDTLSQTISTVAGQLYALSFLFTSDGSDGASLTVRFGDQVLYSAANTPAGGPQAVDLHAVADGSSTTLAFSFSNDPGYYLLDAVSLSAVPEPASLALVAAGLLAAARARRRTPQPHSAA